MMNHLLREFAPLPGDAWKALDDEATARLTVALGARKLVDLDGPHGWDHSATNLGRVGPVIASPAESVIARVRKVLPLTEVRADFAIRRSELADLSRGAADLDLSALDEASLAIAGVENAAVFHGWDAVGITGMSQASPHAPIVHHGDSGHYVQQVATAVSTLKDAGVAGPYALAVGPSDWVDVIEASEKGGYPLLLHLGEILGGPVERVPGLVGGIALSLRGGDFLMELGEDLSIGYFDHDTETVDLYLEETFSFRVATPEAAVALISE
jgi:uncharacterized linocin/CFP29 family protein